MGGVKVTVIMAVYNAEPYLRRCLDSLQAQTLKDFDVILVDDGSTDKSLAIAEEYAQEDSRFRVYHKENGGVSSARQYGIERLAENGGKYSIHVDPDDWVEPQMLERLYEKAKDTEADMVVCDFYYNTQEKQWRCKQNPKSDNPNKVAYALFLGLHGSLWNKLIRSACYTECDIQFPIGLNYCEDYFVNVCFMQKIRKVAYLSEAFYHYDIYSNSFAETRKTDGKYIDYTRTEIVKRCREVVPDNMKGWQFYYFEIRKAFDIMRNGSMSDEEFKKFFHNIPASLIFHRFNYRVSTMFTMMAIHSCVSYSDAAKMYRHYLSFRRFVKV